MRTPEGTRQFAATLAATMISQLAYGANDADNYEGDKVSFARNIPAQLVNFDNTLGAVICLPAGTAIWGMGNYKKDPIMGTLFRTNKKMDTPGCEGKADIPKGSTLLIETSNGELPATPNRFGLTYGALAVPFKFHLTGKKDFTGSATVGPYLGYRTDPEGTRGFGASFVGFLGASNIAVTQNVNGSSSTQNLAGFSWGFAVIGSVKGNFQLGGVIGFDRVSANAGYQYNGKPWVALELGYSFLQ